MRLAGRSAQRTVRPCFRRAAANRRSAASSSSRTSGCVGLLPVPQALQAAGRVTDMHKSQGSVNELEAAGLARRTGDVVPGHVAVCMLPSHVRPQAASSATGPRARGTSPLPIVGRAIRRHRSWRRRRPGGGGDGRVGLHDDVLLEGADGLLRGARRLQVVHLLCRGSCNRRPDVCAPAAGRLADEVHPGLEGKVLVIRELRKPAGVTSEPAQVIPKCAAPSAPSTSTWKARRKVLQEGPDGVRCVQDEAPKVTKTKLTHTRAHGDETMRDA